MAGRLPSRAPGRRTRAALSCRWDQLVTSYRAQHAADQQAKTDALLLEVIDALARLLNDDHPGNSTA
ncbi:MAG TPA: hypothetical protein VGF32_01390 [Streptosporangiaceae bacterium]